MKLTEIKNTGSDLPVLSNRFLDHLAKTKAPTNEAKINPNQIVDKR